MKQIKIKKHVGLIHIGNREKSGIQIFEKLKQYDFEMSQWDVINTQNEVDGINAVDVIVVNIGTVIFDYDDLLAHLFDTDIPIIINEAEITNKYTGAERLSWERHLLNKIDSNISVLPDNLDRNANNNESVDLSVLGIKQVWILAASIGGPEAIQQFLSEFDNEHKYLFIIIQHIDKEFIPMMAKQFEKVSHIQVDIPLSGMKVTIPSCIVYPTDENIVITEKGIIELIPMNETFAFSPCIDAACELLNKNIKNLNIAIFSGMSSDGIAAAKLVKNSGGKIITQTESSCVLSSIVEGVKINNSIDFEGSPKEMAQYIKNN